MDRSQAFKYTLSNWWNKLISYWMWILIGVVILVSVGIFFQDTIAFILSILVDAIVPSENNFINWGVENPIGFILVLASVYLLILVLVALIESQNIRRVNIIHGESSELLEVIIENISRDDLFECKVILEDIYHEEKSIINENDLKIISGMETLIWKDNERADLEILKDERATISLAKYDELTDTSHLFTSAGEIELPKGICKVRASLIMNDLRGKVTTIVFWVVIQFGENELEELELDDLVGAEAIDQIEKGT
jgi:hypothetical protein